MLDEATAEVFRSNITQESWWRDNKPQLILVSNQGLVLEFLCCNLCKNVIRRNLWVDLNRLQTKHSGPWIFVGDFNAALGAHEKCTRRLPSKISCEDCLLWTNANKQLHLTTTTTGVRFTWDNSRFVLSWYL